MPKQHGQSSILPTKYVFIATRKSVPQQVQCLQTLESQAIRDRNIIDLAQTMSHIYAFIIEAQQVNQYEAQANLLVVMVKQTEECAYFIQAYARHQSFSQSLFFE